MPSILDSVRAALRRPAPTLAQLADALTTARKADVEARAVVERQVAAVAGGFLDDDTKRAAARAKLADLRAEAEDMAAILAEVERRRLVALEAEEQARRRGLYDAAKAEADAAALALAKVYPKLAGSMVAMLRDLAKAQQAVSLVNGQLPDGATPLEDPEMLARGVPSQSREIVADEEVELWARLDADTPLDVQDHIYDVGGGWGRRPGDLQAAFRLRRFRKITYRDAIPSDYPTPLAGALQLPAVRGSGMLWGEAYPIHNPGLAAAVMGLAEPGVVLARIADLDAIATARPTKAERPLKIEWGGFVDVEPLPDAPPRTYERSRLGPVSGSQFGASPFASPGARTGSRAGARR